MGCGRLVRVIMFSLFVRVFWLVIFRFVIWFSLNFIIWEGFFFLGFYGTNVVFVIDGLVFFGYGLCFFF